MNFNFEQRCFSFLTILIVISEGIHLVHSSQFGYSRPDQRRWARHHTECSGQYQSPIAVYSSKAIPLHMPAIEMVGYHNLLPSPLQIHNNGHSVSLSIPKDTLKKDERIPYIFGGKLHGQYEVEGLHFHWGDKNNRGSEHVINDVRYPMEMHIIHRNKKYKDVPEALNHEDGLCVIGIFYHLSEHEGPQLVNILRNISAIEEFDKTVALNSTFSLYSFIGGIDLDRFYTYRGSLTTPPCSEAVTWVLFPDTIPVSNSQLYKLRQLNNGISGSNIVDNFRHLQPLGNRRVFVRKVNSKSTVVSDTKNQISYTDWNWLF